MDMYKVDLEDLKELTGELLEQQYTIVTVSADGKKFNAIRNKTELNLNPKNPPTDVSFKEYFFPKSESLFFYKRNKDEIELEDARPEENKTIIIGAKPCDAASVPVLSKVFNWDYKDDFFNKRVENTVIIGTECRYKDSFCFCESVGLSPYSEKGSDIFLYPLKDNFFLLKPVTEKGEKFINDHSSLIKNKTDEKPEEIAGNKAQQTFDVQEIKNWLDKNFTHDFWNEAGELCIGCAQCAYVCPTCHCFDIMDESCGYDCGRRVKNWDSCQFGLFTKHASGHNPRNDQSKRYRQRISHKFKYYKDRFDEILCTGCGRCSRGCPVSINIAEILQDIESLQIGH